jgi:hypothetical protein
MAAHRIVVTAAFAACFVVGCSSTEQPTASPRSLSTGPAHVAASSGLAALAPTPTQVASPLVGPRTRQLPGPTRSVTVTLVNASSPTTVVYEKTIVDPTMIGRLVSAVDSLSADTGATRLCALSVVDLQLAFTSPAGTATIAEDPGCRSSVLTIGGQAGPELDSDLLPTVEAMLGIEVTINQAGQAIVSSVAPS